jgi:8-oxo-dGTP diphosphatase
MTRSAIVVVAAVVERDGCFLVTRRRPGTHLEGCWEFPGGKTRRDETLEQALRREILEELNADVINPREIFETSHVYPEQTVELHFFRCSLGGVLRPVLGQEVRWVAPADLATLQFPPADAELIARFLLS